jgi:hypothetical protein
MGPTDKQHIQDRGARISRLFSIPLEVRQQIYDCLLPRVERLYPVWHVGIHSVSHEPPRMDLLRIHPQLTEELLDHFYTLSTWTVVLAYDLNFFRNDPDFRNLESAPCLKRIRKVELRFFCDGRILSEYPSVGIENLCSETCRRALRACQLLAHAPELSSVTISWTDTTSVGTWQQKNTILLPLCELISIRSHKFPEVLFTSGRFISSLASADTDDGDGHQSRIAFVKSLRSILGDRLRS